MIHPAPHAPDATRRPIILQVLPSLVTGGVERGTIEITEAIARAGWTALVASAGGPLVAQISAPAAAISSCPSMRATRSLSVATPAALPA